MCSFLPPGVKLCGKGHTHTHTSQACVGYSTTCMRCTKIHIGGASKSREGTRCGRGSGEPELRHLSPIKTLTRWPQESLANARPSRGCRRPPRYLREGDAEAHADDWYIMSGDSTRHAHTWDETHDCEPSMMLHRRGRPHSSTRRLQPNCQTKYSYLLC